MKLREAILLGHARAYGQLSDLIRERGGTYRETYDRVCAIFENAGRVAPTLADFDEKMAEADEEDSGG